MVRENLERVRARIAEAARRAGRDPAGVRLLCVTKGVPPPYIEEAIAAGAGEIGENRVQETQPKRAALAARHPELRWHLIGHLQRNKVKPAVELFDWIHSVDSTELVEALGRQVALRQSLPPTRSGAQGERRLELLVQVNISGEATKHGCRPEEAEGLAGAILKKPGLIFSGLMTMPPFSDDPEGSRPFFSELRRIRDRLQEKGMGRPLELSMGMSRDFEAAVEEGATMVRIGTAIFGARTG